MNKPKAIRRRWLACLVISAAVISAISNAQADIVFTAFSAYHHIEVIDEGGMRILSFNGSRETRMLRDVPLQGHFEYTEYFHMPWLWNTNVRRVLMIGLGGGSTQRSYQHYYTNVVVDTVEIDPVVVNVAKDYFFVTESPTHKIYVNDGRVFLRRTTNTYDAILMDAYATTRYGSSIPPHLTTKEFFTLARNHLTTNGVMGYNIIGQVRGLNEDFLATMFRTMKEVFPQVYLFPANESQNVVFLATKSAEAFDAGRVQRQGTALIRGKRITIPDFSSRLRSFVNTPPPKASSAIILTDDRARVEGLLR
jgi:spermidine synthase